jgi:hypothetical protein
MYKAIFSGLLAFGAIVCLAQTSPEPSPEIKALLDRIGNVHRPNYNTIHALTASERGMLLEYFRGQVRQLDEADKTAPIKGLNLISQETAHQARILLGDPEILDPALRSFLDQPMEARDRKAHAALFASIDPEIVKAVVPVMQTEEPLEFVQRSDVDGYIPKSYTAAGLMLTIVGNSPAFDGKTRKWAMDNNYVPAEQRQPMVRKWYKENEAFFKVGDYKSVKPGEDLIAQGSEERRAHIRESAIRDAPAVAAEGTTVSAPPAIAAAAGGWGALGYGLVGVLILLLVAAMFLYSRSGRHV